MPTVVVLGAGLSGLVAARTLVEAGCDVTVVDKGRGVGGRLATRRIGDATLDHGAQFFTVRGDDFRQVVDAAIDDGVVAEWCQGFGDVPDGYPRYFCPAGMTSLAKWLARDLDVRVGTEAHLVRTNADGVHVVGEDDKTLINSDHAVVTAPIPQMLTLFDRGGLKLGHDVAHALKTVDYFATLALLVVCEGGAPISATGGRQYETGPFTFVADNQQKGVSKLRALTFHAEHDYSRARFDDDSDEVHAELRAQAEPWLEGAHIIETQLKKWRYAGPVTPLPDRTMIVTSQSATIALAGDAFGGPKVEGAFNSGRAAARAIEAALDVH